MGPAGADGSVANRVAAAPGPTIPADLRVWETPELSFTPLTRLAGLQVTVTLTLPALGGPVDPLGEEESLAAHETAPLELAPLAAVIPHPLSRRASLVFDHQSLARVSLGALSAPDGSIATAWTTTSPVRWRPVMVTLDHGRGAVGRGAVGRSAARPSQRIPPMGAHAGRGKRAASMTRERIGGLSTPRTRPLDWVEIMPIPGASPTHDLAAGAVSAVVHLADDGQSLDAEACRLLDRLALHLRRTGQHVTVRTHAHAARGGHPLARARGAVIRAYLAKRGVALDQVRIKPEDAKTAHPMALVSRRVDLIYSPG